MVLESEMLSMMNVLICDETESDALSLTDILDYSYGSNMKVKTLYKASDTRSFIRGNRTVDICFIELVMPEMNGIELAKALRTDGYEGGIVSGIGGGKFTPELKITRQEAMLMIYRAAQIARLEGSSGAIAGFSDAGSVSDWALDAANWNVGSGLIQGSSVKLRPLDNITRAETAVVVLRLLQKAGLVDVRTPQTA